MDTAQVVNRAITDWQDFSGRLEAVDRVEVRPVRVERAMGDQWLIAEGLRAGERVVVDGFQKVQPGAPVKPVPVAGPAGEGTLFQRVGDPAP